MIWCQSGLLIVGINFRIQCSHLILRFTRFLLWHLRRSSISRLYSVVESGVGLFLELLAPQRALLHQYLLLLHCNRFPILRIWLSIVSIFIEGYVTIRDRRLFCVLFHCSHHFIFDGRSTCFPIVLLARWSYAFLFHVHPHLSLHILGRFIYMMMLLYRL